MKWLWLFVLSSLYAASIDQEIERYLMENPEVVYQALALHEKNVLDERTKETLLSDTSQITVENEAGEHTLVMFIDYRCGACRKTYPWVDRFIKNHPEVKLMIRPYPVLGVESVQASLMVFDGKQQDSLGVHYDLIDAKFSFSKERLRELGKQYKINVHLPSVLSKHWAFELLEKNQQQSLALNNHTVPFFILAVNDEYTLLKGLSSSEELEKTYKQMA